MSHFGSFWVILGQKKKFGSKKFLGQKNFGSKKFLGQKNFWVKKIFGSKKFWVKKIFGSKNFLGQKNFWVKKIMIIMIIMTMTWMTTLPNLAHQTNISADWTWLAGPKAPPFGLDFGGGKLNPPIAPLCGGPGPQHRGLD